MGFELSIVEANKETYQWEFIASLTLPEDGEGFPLETVEANARLIAAAPELLEACKAAIALLDHQGMYCEERAILIQAVAKVEVQAMSTETQLAEIRLWIERAEEHLKTSPLMLMFKAQLTRLTFLLSQLEQAEATLENEEKVCTQLAYQNDELLTKNLALQDRTEQAEAERERLGHALTDAALEIHCAGPVSERIRVLKKEWSEHIQKLEQENTRLRAALESIRQITEQHLTGYGFPQLALIAREALKP